MSRMISFQKNIAAPTITTWTEIFSHRDGIYSYLASRNLTFAVGGKRDRSYNGYLPLRNRFKGDAEHVIVYHAEKVRRKAIRVLPSKKNKAYVTRENVRKPFATLPVRDNHWKVTFYKFRLDRVVSVKQEGRSFKAVLLES